MQELTIRGLLPSKSQPPAPDFASYLHGREPMSIFTILFIVLLAAWILGWGVFHVAGGLIHLLLIAAVIALILHFVRGTARAI